jgi:hypothetical protein
MKRRLLCLIPKFSLSKEYGIIIIIIIWQRTVNQWAQRDGSVTMNPHDTKKCAEGPMKENSTLSTNGKKYLPQQQSDAEFITASTNISGW